MVLLRGVDERGFVFHTNYNSRKARELDANPHAALCFHWPTLEEQIRIEGAVERAAGRRVRRLLRRPSARQPDRRLGVGAERGRSTRAKRSSGGSAATEERFAGQPVPRPPFWGGFRIVPSRIEFWYGRTEPAARSHSSTRASGDGWTIEKLYP